MQINEFLTYSKNFSKKTFLTSLQKYQTVIIFLTMKQTNTTADLKQHNKQAIKKALFTLGSATKAELAQETGLSVVTCGTIVNELIASVEDHEY